MQSQSHRATRVSHAERRSQAEANTLEAALQLVSERGALAMTLADVGERAGYSRSLPAHYFGSKDGLVAALAEYMIDRFTRLVLQGPKPKQGLTAVLRRVDVYLSAAAREPMQFRALQVLMTECITGNVKADARESVSQVNNAVIDYFERQLRVAVELGEIPADVAVRETAVMIVGILRGVLAMWFLDPSFDLTRVKDRVLQQLRALAIG